MNVLTVSVSSSAGSPLTLKNGMLTFQRMLTKKAARLACNGLAVRLFG